MRYKWDCEGREVSFKYVIREGQEAMATAHSARNAESIVEALNAWDRARADVKKMLEPARQ